MNKIRVYTPEFSMSQSFNKSADFKLFIFLSSRVPKTFRKNYFASYTFEGLYPRNRAFLGTCLLEHFCSELSTLSPGKIVSSLLTGIKIEY